ncbi:MAG: ABC transporter ATP-binding protein [Clostridia bacterium]|nr:ABC transporter ATP-binding protein [Clostridia bacterium]
MKIAQISAFYGKKQALNHVTFELKPKKFTALIGKNGCGKSTLLKCIAGQIPHTGEIPLPREPRERAKAVALLPQSLPALPMEAEALVAMGRTPYLNLAGTLTPTDREKIEEAIRLAGIQELRHRNAATLSGGELQKVYLAMVLAQDARILLLDEPTAHMDMGYAADFLRLLKTLNREQGKTVLAVLHDLNAAAAFADELLLMEQGRLTDPARVEEVFGVRKIFYSENGETKYFYQ